MSLNNEQERQLEQLFREMYVHLHTYARHQLEDWHLAEEAVQEVFRIACLKPEEFFSSENPRGWLLVTLRNVLRNMKRFRARLNRFLTQAMERAEAQAYQEEDFDFALVCEELLGKEDYALLKRVVLDRCTMGEAAEEIGVSPEACKKRIQRIKAKLKKYLGES